MDKLLHFIVFGISSLILYFLIKKFFPTINNPKTITLLVAIAFAFMTEIIQLYIPGRTFDLIDIGADIIGSYIFLYLFLDE